MQAAAAKRLCDAEIVRISQEIDATAATLGHRLGGHLNMSTWLATFLKAEQLGRELQAAQERQRAAQRALMEALAAYKKASQEAEMLRTLRSQQHQAHLEELARAEQLSLEEMSLSRWQEQGDEPDSGA